LGFVAGIGYGATGYSTVSRAAISFVTSQIWTDANQGAAVQVETTPNGSTSRAVAARFGPSGGFSVGTLTDPGIGAILANTSILSQSPTNGIGYATGAGGTIGQATSKATSVALNTICGAVTMANALLAAGTVVSFVLQDTAIAATDVLVLNHISGGTPGSYSLNAQAAAGSATINVRNNTAGSLSEAIVIQFVVIKGVNA
jgi:hypothetical protein